MGKPLTTTTVCARRLGWSQNRDYANFSKLAFVRIQYLCAQNVLFGIARFRVPEKKIAHSFGITAFAGISGKRC